MNNNKKVLIFANSSWYLYNFWLNNIEIFQASGYKVILVSNDDGYASRLREKGFVFYPLNISRGIKSVFGDLRLIFFLRSIIREVNPDIVHNLNPKPVLYNSILLLVIKAFGQGKKILIVNSFPGLGRLYSEGSVVYSFLRVVFEKLYGFIAKSSVVKSVFQVGSDREYFLKKNIISKRSSYIIRGSGVDINNFYPSTELRRDGNLNVIMASRMTSEKGVYVYLLACKELNKKHKNISFLLAGGTDQNEPDLISYNKLIHLCEHSGVNYLGHVSNMSELLKTIDVAVLPTMRREGVPRILVESAASGVSLVATGVGGCPDVVHHNVNGFIINENSVEELVLAIEKFIGNDELLEKFSLASREIVLKEMNSTYVANEYMNIYKITNLEWK